MKQRYILTRKMITKINEDKGSLINKKLEEIKLEGHNVAAQAHR